MPKYKYVTAFYRYHCDPEKYAHRVLFRMEVDTGYRLTLESKLEPMPEGIAVFDIRQCGAYELCDHCYGRGE